MNVLCVLSEIGTGELTRCEPIFRWWREQGNPAPLLLSRQEVIESADCFPIEYHDIQSSGRVLFGEDLFASMVIHDHDYRAQVEHEIRAKILRLRQKAAGVMQDDPLLLRLMADSVSTFCVLLRHALVIAGEARSTQKRDIVARAAAKFGLVVEPLNALLDLREGKRKARELKPVALLDQYLKELGRAAAAVNALDGKGE